MLRVAYLGRRTIGRERRNLIFAQTGVDLVRFDAEPELVVSIVGTCIFTLAEISRVPLGIINLHLAPLPEYRGRYSFTHAILNGEDMFGVALHYVTEELDAGPVIAERRFSVRPDDTAWRLYLRAQRSGRELFDDVLPGILFAAFCGGRVAAVPQDETRAYYYDRHSLPTNDGSPLMARALAWR